MLKRILILTAALAVLVPAVASAKVVRYSGKTREGTKISFVLDHGWVDRIATTLPTTCESGQGGTPKVYLMMWDAPYKFRVGYAVKVSTKNPTRHYHFSTHLHRGGVITGKMSMNWSYLATDGWGGYKVVICYGTGNFRLKPH